MNKIPLNQTRFFCLVWLLATVSLSAQDRPNIVFIFGDDISQEDFGCYGHPVIQTPNVDTLAAHGMRFDNAYLTVSSCSPSRISIITGRYPHNTGAPELHVNIPSHQLRFVRLLKNSGYYTVLSGKNHMVGNDKATFDKITNGGGPGKEEDWVSHIRNRPRDKPFFFWFSAVDAHRLWQITDEVEEYDPEDVVVPPYYIDNQVTREDLAAYYHEVSRFDYYIGLVVEELRKQGVLDNTMIVVAADNGRPFPRAKGTVYDSGVRAPWIVHYPERVAGGSVTESLISSIDFSATCLELAGLSRPESIQGKSFLPILDDPNATIRDMVFAQQNWHVYSLHQRMVRYGNYTYLRNNYHHYLNLTDSSDLLYPTGEELWKAQANGTILPEQQQTFLPQFEELYQIVDDPNQISDLSKNPDYSEIMQLGRELLDSWVQETGDTIPTNPTPHRHDPPRIENGVIIPAGQQIGERNPHAEMPGAARNAQYLYESGPIWLSQEERAILGLDGTHWSGYEIIENGLVDTVDWMGWIYINQAPLIYSYLLEGWIYMEEPAADAPGAWGYTFK